MSVPKSKPSHCFDHSTDQYSGRCHGCTAVPNGHGSFHRPIGRVFRVYDPTGTRSRRCHARFLRDTCRLNTSESKVRVRTLAFGLRIGRFISANDTFSRMVGGPGKSLQTDSATPGWSYSCVSAWIPTSERSLGQVSISPRLSGVYHAKYFCL